MKLKAVILTLFAVSLIGAIGACTKSNSVSSPAPAQQNTKTATMTVTKTPFVMTATSTVTQTIETPSITLTVTITMTGTNTPTITITPTETPVCNFAFGNETASGNGNFSTGALWASGFTAGADTTINEIWSNLSYASSYCVGLYEDNSGSPGNMIASSGVQNGVPGWNRASIGTQSVTSGQTYWLVFISQNNTIVSAATGSTPTKYMSYNWSSIVSAGMPTSTSGWSSWTLGAAANIYSTYCY